VRLEIGATKMPGLRLVSATRLQALAVLGAVAVSAANSDHSSASVASAPGSREQIALEPCRPAGFEEVVRCGTFVVQENRELAGGRRIPLRIVLLPARRTAVADPIVDIEGGPGASAVAAARTFVESPLRRNHDLVFVDARGTGGSGPLRCDYQDTQGVASYLEDFLPLEGIRSKGFGSAGGPSKPGRI
jgi:hypothetical protein